MILLKPGLPISLLFNANLNDEIKDIRSSVIYSILGEKITIAQTDPLISVDQQNDTIMVSFVIQEKGNPVRYGFQGKLANFIEEYQLSSSKIVPAVIVLQKTIPEPYKNLRMFYRIQPPNNFGLLLTIFEQPVSIIDISLGGAIVSFSPSPDLETDLEIGNTLKITLTIDEQNFGLEGVIKRIFFPEDERWHEDLRFVALEFFGRTPVLNRALGEKILSIQRELRSKGYNI